MTASADLILHNVTAYPDARATSQVDAIALQGNRIIGLGNYQDLDPLVGPDTIIENLDGKTILPGLIDAHIHMQAYADSIVSIDCQTNSLEDCLARIREQAGAVEPGQWITGHGWDQNIWGEWPTREKLDAAAPSNPLYLTARSLHAGAVNTAGLRAADLNRHSQDPADGRLGRTAQGELTGIVYEGAMRLIHERIPPLSPAEIAARLEQAQHELWRFGLVGVHDFDGAKCFSALQVLQAKGTLKLRVLKHIRAQYLTEAAALGLRPGFGNDWLRIGNIKLFSDGALGPRTAAMIEPYDDGEQGRGMLLLEEEEIVGLGIEAASAGFSLAIHAIGDRANQTTLTALERLALELKGIPLRLQPRVEHLQLVSDVDMAKPAQLKAIASMQPIHALSDQAMAEHAWGKRCERSYPWSSILKTGATLVFGSDAPVESPNPFWGIHAAVNRMQWDGSRNSPFTPEQRIPLDEALSAYTSGPCLAAAGLLGSGRLHQGSQADFIVLEQDPYAIQADELHSLKPVGTCIGGEWVFRDF